MNWSSDVHFGLPAYDSEVAFNDWIYLDSFEWDAVDASQITFTNIKMDGSEISSLTVKTQFSNITFVNLDTDDTVKYTVEGTGAQHLTVPEPTAVYVDGVLCSKGDKWDYSGGWLIVSGATTSVEAKYGYDPSEYPYPIYPYPSPPVISETAWYMRSDTQVTNTVTGYVLRETQTTSSTNVLTSINGNVTAYYGYKVRLLRSDGETSELTSNIVYSWRISDGEGIQNVLWTPPATSLQVGYDAIQVDLYVKFGSGDWQSMATFVSDRLMKKSIVASEWAFQTYTKYVYSGGKTYAYVYWGDDSYETSIAGIQFIEPNVYETMNYKLQSGDFIGMILFPFLNLIGPLFYVFPLLIVCVPLYVRYKSFAPILIIFILFGGSTGLFSLILPVEVAGLVGFFLTIGLAGLLWKVFR